MPVRVEMQEWETRELSISADAARTLADICGPRLSVGIGSTSRTWTVTTSSHVGAIVTPEVELLIRPKVPMHNLFMMLDVGLPTSAFSRDTFGFGSDRSLLAAIAGIYARSVERATSQGLLHAYRQESDRLQTLRGRVAIGEIIRRPGSPIPVPCTFEEYTADIFENRALRAALDRLLRVPGVRPQVRRSLSHALARFDDVDSNVPIDPAGIDRLIYTRLNRHYRQPLGLASLILRNLSLIDRVGASDASAFTIDMNDLFQRWVTDRLQRHLRPRLRVVAEPREHLGIGRKVTMYPDLTFWAGEQLVFVGDVKYKLTGSGLARNADYYQLLAYTTALGLPEGLLIYCQVDGAFPPSEVVVRNAQTVLRTHALDLSGPPAAAEVAVLELADAIRSNAQKAHGDSSNINRLSTQPRAPRKNTGLNESMRYVSSKSPRSRS